MFRSRYNAKSLARTSVPPNPSVEARPNSKAPRSGAVYHPLRGALLLGPPHLER